MGGSWRRSSGGPSIQGEGLGGTNTPSLLQSHSPIHVIHSSLPPPLLLLQLLRLFLPRPFLLLLLFVLFQYCLYYSLSLFVLLPPQEFPPHFSPLLSPLSKKIQTPHHPLPPFLSPPSSSSSSFSLHSHSPPPL